MKKQVLLTGFGYENFGSRLMFETVAHHLLDGAAPVIEMPRGSQWHAWYRGYFLMPNALIRRGLDRWCARLAPGPFARLGFKTLTDIGTVLDISGYLHDHANAPMLMNNKLHLLRLAKSAGAKIAFLPHSLSIQQAAHRPIFQGLYALADIVYARDAHSHAAAAALGLPQPIGLCSDFVLCHPRLATFETANDPAARDVLLVIPNFKSQTADIVAAAQRMLSAHGDAIRKVVIASFYTGEKAAYLEEIRAALAGSVEVSIAPDPEAVWDWLPRALICVSARYHGCCLALYAQVPLLTVGWSEKYESLLQAWQYPLNIADGDTVEAGRAYYRGAYRQNRAEKLNEVRAMFAELRARLANAD
ncbi:polysaccharide pyruvyl transferase family protein [Methylomonas sp. CM2]|uniref:polysaccharide pyruvyl transferase family protein n=1 Tax=Methylomonas sp. CM2 TaxID=3417647 RepID=UPI003CF36F5A